MPSKIKLKSEKQLKAALELVEWKMSTKKPCHCLTCSLNMAFLIAKKNALLWALGQKVEKIDRLLKALKLQKAKATKHQSAHVE